VLLPSKRSCQPSSAEFPQQRDAKIIKNVVKKTRNDFMYDNYQLNLICPE
jgi:hypothetical protein